MPSDSETADRVFLAADKINKLLRVLV